MDMQCGRERGALSPDPFSHWLPLGVERSYTIAFTARSGSNEICNLLTRNGLGEPGEHFQALAGGGPRSAAEESRVADRIAAIVRDNARNGIFASKMAHDHRAAVEGVWGRTHPGETRMDRILPRHKWIWLVRRDKIAQAVSLLRAERSGVWARRIGSDGPAEDAAYDFYLILSRVMMLQVADYAWQLYFEANAIDPLRIAYEDFYADPDASLRRLVGYLNEVPADTVRGAVDTAPTLAIQRDDVSLAWQRQFRAHLEGVGDLDPDRAFGPQHARWLSLWRELQPG